MRITDLMERPRSRDLLADWYSAILDSQAESGVSIAEYADEVGVSAATLYQWRHRLAGDVKPTSASSSQESGLIEVVLASDRGLESAPTRSASLTVQLSSSRAIKVSSNFEPEVLQRLVRALESC